MANLPDPRQITAEQYFADLFTTGIKSKLEEVKTKILKEAEEKFKNEADEIMKNWIFYMVQHFKVERRFSDRNYAAEIVVQLPILKELEGKEDGKSNNKNKNQN